MSQPQSTPDHTAPINPAEYHTTLFVNLVLQQTQFALTFLGQAPHPADGKTTLDLDAARLMIDQLEMLQSKTKGNLDKQETQFLEQNLMTLRLAFVEAVDKKTAAPAPAPAATTSATSPASQPGPGTSGTSGPAEGQSAEASKPDDSRVRYTKKY